MVATRPFFCPGFSYGALRSAIGSQPADIQSVNFCAIIAYSALFISWGASVFPARLSFNPAKPGFNAPASLPESNPAIVAWSMLLPETLTALAAWSRASVGCQQKVTLLSPEANSAHPLPS
jgi:hypothetical protein